MCARSASHISSLKDEPTLRLLNFLIIGLCNSSPNSEGCWYSELNSVPLSVADWPQNQDLVSIHHISDFEEHKMLYHTVVYEKLFFLVNL